jgi:hypothetical protein
MLSLYTLKQECFFCVCTTQGETCSYRHSLVAKNSEQACVFWASSACRAGAACPFIHHGVDFTAVIGAAPGSHDRGVCHFFERGTCTKGAACSFEHSRSSTKASITASPISSALREPAAVRPLSVMLSQHPSEAADYTEVAAATVPTAAAAVALAPAAVATVATAAAAAPIANAAVSLQDLQGTVGKLVMTADGAVVLTAKGPLSVVMGPDGPLVFTSSEIVPSAQGHTAAGSDNGTDCSDINIADRKQCLESDKPATVGQQSTVAKLRNSCRVRSKQELRQQQQEQQKLQKVLKHQQQQKQQHQLQKQKQQQQQQQHKRKAAAALSSSAAVPLLSKKQRRAAAANVAAAAAAAAKPEQRLKAAAAAQASKQRKADIKEQKQQQQEQQEQQQQHQDAVTAAAAAANFRVRSFAEIMASKHAAAAAAT